jgi:hypothetical protein
MKKRPAFADLSACRKSLFAPLSKFQNFGSFETYDFNGAGHPSRVSRAHPSFPLKKSWWFIDNLKNEKEVSFR